VTWGVVATSRDCKISIGRLSRPWGAGLPGVRRAEVIARKSVIGTAVATTILAIAPVAAQTQSYKLHCMSTGNNAPEKLDDREGHFIQVSTATCRIEGGLQDDGITTQHIVWEIDKGNWTLISGTNVTRKPGSMSITRPSGTLTMRMENGRPAGWTAAGKGVFPFAAGGAAPLAGTSYSWTARPTGPSQYITEATPD
jgi:hypothetical protein